MKKRGVERVKTDALVIGSGIAGLRAALELGRRGHKVALVTKRRLTDGNSVYAQGGIAAVDPDRVNGDSFELHVKDTLSAGAGLCDGERVRFFVENAFSKVVRPLIEYGVRFSENRGASGDEYRYVLHQEGGHSRKRIYCVNDSTGRAVIEKLAEHVSADDMIEVYESHMAIDLITSVRPDSGGTKECRGAYVLDIEKEYVRTFEAKTVFLATGGVGKVYLYTSNADSATGDGVAMAYRAGTAICNMEFMQFHPTCLYTPSPRTPAERRFLITEALRGKSVGAILTLQKDSNEDFVRTQGYHKDGSASTRDIIARAIDAEIKKRGIEHVYLNATSEVTGRSRDEIRKGFPDIYRTCKNIGIDMTVEPIPVVPAAHYTCGGIAVSENGETGISGLYAIGECSCGGLMGANRLASNSLPAAALYGLLAAEHASELIGKQKRDGKSGGQVPLWQTGDAVKSQDEVQISHNWEEVRRIMWNLVGIVRSGERLLMAMNRIRLIKEEIRKYYWEYIVTSDLLELRNIVDVAEIIIDAALRRRESRGTHYRLDYPDEMNGGVSLPQQ